MKLCHPGEFLKRKRVPDGVGFCTKAHFVFLKAGNLCCAERQRVSEKLGGFEKTSMGH